MSAEHTCNCADAIATEARRLAARVCDDKGDFFAQTIIVDCGCRFHVVVARASPKLDDVIAAVRDSEVCLKESQKLFSKSDESERPTMTG
jgi:hypothetical protein